MNLASALPAMTAVAPPAASAAGPASPPPDDGGFARALQQARQGRRDGAGSDRPPATRTQASGSAPDAEGADNGAATEVRPRTPGDADTAEATAGRQGQQAPADPWPAEEASLPAWMTAALPAVPAEPLPDADDGTLLANADAASPGVARTPPAPLGDDAGDDRLPGLDLQATRRSGLDDRGATEDPDHGHADDAGATFQEALVASSSNATSVATPTALAAAPAVAHAIGAGNAEQVAEHTLRVPLHSPAFAPALGAQLTLLVKEGVTEARLHLNPAEMGPISVQIQVEGGHARVEMAAEMAATRQVLEQSMPALAGALRDSGLTLTGGGVFEQSARQGQPGDAERRPGSPAGNGGAVTGDPPGMTAEAGGAARQAGPPRGVVDVYA
jgi:flagellar hook-length control protein FliK